MQKKELTVIAQTRNGKKMHDKIENFHKAAYLVKSWGKQQLPSGKTLEEILTINGLSLWDVISPTLATDHVAKILSEVERLPSTPQRLSLYKHKSKILALDMVLPFIGNNNGCIKWPSEPVFLFLGFSYYIYRETLQPIAARISNRKDIKAIALHDSLRNEKHHNSAHANVFQSIWQHWGHDARSKADSLQKVYKTVLHEIKSSNGLSQIIKDQDTSIWPQMRSTFDWLLEVFVPRMLKQSAVAMHILENHRPALIVSPDVNDPRTRIYCLIARQFNVPTLEVQFGGFYDLDGIEWRFFIADHLAVTGDANRKVMLGHAVPPEQMTVTGSPRYDGLLSQPDEIVFQTKEKLKIPKDKTMVLFASQPYYYGTFSSDEARIEMIDALFQTVANMDNLYLVVKPHPIDNAEQLKQLGKGKQNILFVDKRLDIRDLIRTSDAFVTFYSATTFDALVMNKPTINLSFPGSHNNKLFEQSGATFVARTPDDIKRILHVICDGQSAGFLDNLAANRESFLQQWFYQLDGCAAERIEMIALKMAALNLPHNSLQQPSIKAAIL